MKNMKVSAKLLVSFVMVIVMAIVVGAVGIFGMYSINVADDGLYNNNYLPTITADHISQSVVEQRVYLRNFVIYDINADADVFKSAQDNLKTSEKEMEELIAKYEPTIAKGEDQQAFDDFKALYNGDWASIKDQIEKLGINNQMAEAKIALTNASKIAGNLDDLTGKLTQINADDGQATINANTALFKKMAVVSAGILVLAVIISMALALYLSSLIGKPLNKIKEAAMEIAKGNVGIHVDYVSKDEIGGLADAFRTVIETLNLLNEHMEQLKKWATEGRITERVKDDDRIQGAYREIVHGVNGIMGTFSNHFDAIPVGVNIVDTSNSKLYSNPTAEAHKSIDKDNIQTQSKDFTDESGRTAGSLIITIDQTTVMEAQRESERQAANVAAQMALAQKQSEYQKAGIQIILQSVEKLAKGDLNITSSDVPYDEDTKEIHDNLFELDQNLANSCENIRSYIDELSDVLGKMSNKDLNVGITREYLGDFAALKTSINYIIETLNEIFGDISSATNQVQLGSQQVANSSQTLAQGASEQASAVEEISSTITEVASQTKSNAENASKANEISLSAKSDAETGSHQMDEMVNAMEAIKEASKGIASIIKVIEDIAFQTNILALNAAVEAARAGEHGKGFAVVAEEVRTLAARSAEAAKETTEMIDNSLSRVEVGSKIAGDTATALGKIVSGVTNTVDIVATIAEASAQQSTAIAQIDNGVEQISKVTQTNTATAEESASASEEMAGQAQMLQSMISEFTLKGSKSMKRQISAPGNSNVAKIAAPPRQEAHDDIQIDLDDDNFGKY